MKTTKNTVWILLLLLFSSHLCHSQDNYATNIRTTVSEEKKLFINFDIVANDGSRYFHVVLELSYQGAVVKPNPNNLFGDHGHALPPGSKIIYWNYENDFQQDVNQLEVKIFAYREKEPQAKFRSATEQGNFFAPCTMNFTNLSENSDRYEWNFGDAGSGIENNSFELNPSHTYKKGGRYTITLTAINSGLNLQNTFYETIVVKEHDSTTADFKIIGFDNLKNQSVPITIEFKNLSVNADSYQWDFGDPPSGRNNNTSTEKDPSHRYKNPGQYKIELSANNNLSGISATKSLEIVLPGKPAKEAGTTTAKVTGAYEKHKTMKQIWMGTTAVTLVTGTVLLFRSNSLHNDYKEAASTTDATELRDKYEKLDVIYPVAFGAAALSGVMAGIQMKKQKDARIGLQAYPLHEGGGLTLSFHF